ncbi:alpha-glucosidase C-terminal domain-containing protein [Jannaschia seohaensis]|uniref:Maltogenic Amylase, C-terminal domain n=1 Tax=Jannaschia seohaensis TaxID=475081 RepID=A0A2Y8ZXK6_9RHOB|nr:alpha-glucosidase C-terminal domain-containing protein [Jannaschia seohaensis]PWJ21601.1 maltogenic amylase-like enzyme [Jannaschia seohaensis]SSA36804.1 Maltogenic Amylase, C-terminal domain [Jannaschia seohaensis]
MREHARDEPAIGMAGKHHRALDPDHIGKDGKAVDSGAGIIRRADAWGLPSRMAESATGTGVAILAADTNWETAKRAATAATTATPLALRTRGTAVSAENTPFITEGSLELLLPEHPHLFAYLRRHEKTRLLVIVSYSPEPVALPPEAVPDGAGQGQLCNVAHPVRPTDPVALPPFFAGVWIEDTTLAGQPPEAELAR